jgi:hypothetical protein
LTPATRGLQIFLLALCVLTFEVSLTRIFSFILFNHMTYLVVSVALLGFGAAATYLTTRQQDASKDDERFLARHAALFGVSAIASILLISRLHFYVEDMVRYGDFSNVISLVAMVLLAGAPFFFAGACIGHILSRSGEDVTRLYFADLAGAAGGAVLAVVLLTWIGGTAACLAMGALGFLIAALSGAKRRGRYLALCAGGLLFAGWVAKTEWVTLYAPPDKPLFRRHGEVERIEWHPIARIDVTRELDQFHSFGGALAPNFLGQAPVTRLVFQDGGALTGIIEPQGTPEQTPVLGAYMQGAAYVVRPRAKALVIGCGGGVDVEIALHHRARHVVAVDVNPEMIALIRDVYSDFAGGVFQRPEVELVVSEGRHFLTRDHRTFDVIQMSGVDTFTALAAGAYALTENFIYTEEAIDQYLDHLEPDGIVSLTRPLMRPPREAMKLTITAVNVLSRRGVPDPERHVMMLAGQGLGSFFAVPWGITMIKRSPWTPDEVDRLAQWAQANSFQVVYGPYGQGQGTIAQYLRATPEQRERILAEEPLDMAPATDDRPFFFHFYPWGAFWTLHWLRGEGPELSIAVILLLATLVIVTALSAVFILLPLARHRLPQGGAGHAATFTYFASLGLGFILIEISLLQKLTIFLGGPTYSMAVTLFAILLTSGLGSFASKRLAADPERLVALTLPVLAALAVAASLAIGPVTNALLGLGHSGRIASAVALVAPLGFLMGIPFPSGLRIVHRREPAAVPWAWGINACATVVGTVLCIVFSTAWGFSRTLQIGAAVYLVGWTALRAAGRRAR